MNTPHTKRLILFAHYHSKPSLLPYIRHHLGHLKKIATQLEFGSTSLLDTASSSWLHNTCDAVHNFENIGYDFFMWKQMLNEINLDGYDELVLTNSSIVGPTTSLGLLFNGFEKIACDFWGLTTNHEFGTHLQSYFLVFKSTVIHSPVFQEFWNGVVAYHDKRDVIMQYEVGLTQILIDHGFRYDSVVKSPHVKKPWFGPQNITLRSPLKLLEAGVPYIKLEVLRDNPGHVNLKKLYQKLKEVGITRSDIFDT